jgi:hypothetical protein
MSQFGYLNATTKTTARNFIFGSVTVCLLLAAAATAAVGIHSRCRIYRKIKQYLRRTFSLPSTCTCVTIEFFFLLASSGDQAKVVLPSIYHKFPRFLSFFRTIDK